MNCEVYREQIPLYIKKEIEGEQRVILKNHLKSCINCRKDYLAQIKMYYILDREEILDPTPHQVMKTFKENVLERSKESSQNKGHLNTKWFWYAAAATLFIGIIIGRFVIPDNTEQDNLSGNRNKTLSQLIVSEDWNKLEIVLSDKDEYNRYSTDTIPIHILLDKLSALQKMGVHSVPIAGTLDHNYDKKTPNNKYEPQIQISLKDFIRLLEQIKVQRSTITLEEVSSLLAKI
jgi:hypothetical protein